MTHWDEMTITDGWVYHSVELPTRHNVREPIPNPVLHVIRPSGRRLTIRTNEAQLQQMITDCAETLRRMRLCRGATQPTSTQSV